MLVRDFGALVLQGLMAAPERKHEAKDTKRAREESASEADAKKVKLDPEVSKRLTFALLGAILKRYLQQAQKDANEIAINEDSQAEV